MRLQPDEQELFRGHPSWRSMVAFHVEGLIAAVLAGAVAGIASRQASGHIEVGWVIAGVLVVFALGLATGLVRRASTTYVVTSRRLVIERGILSRDVQETRLERVQNVASRQTLGERLLRVGSLHFDTAAGAGYDFSFRGVARPRQLVQTVDRALQSSEPAPSSMP